MPIRVHPWLPFILAVFVTLSGCSPPTAALPPTPLASASESRMVSEPAPASRAPAKRIARPVEAIGRVMIISIDGLRPDLALRAYMPRLRALCASGSYTFWAETAAEAYTLPCHVSMLTGVSSDIHGVTWNDYIEEAWPNAPTLFELAHEVGYSTALVTGKMKFITLLKPTDVAQPPSAVASVGNEPPGVPQTDDEGGPSIQNPKSKIQNPDLLLFQRPAFRASNTLDHYYLPETEPISDHEVAAEAVRILRDHRPEVFFIHFPGVDTVGHERGWGTPEQITAIEQADAAVGQVLDALAELELTDSTLVILTADHGGAGLDHQAGDPRAQFIPWIVSGPGIRRDYDLTLTDRAIRIEDTFATACAFLGIDCNTAFGGIQITESLEERDRVPLPTGN